VNKLTTFPNCSEFEKAARAADRLGIPCTVLSPEPGYRPVGVPAIVVDEIGYGRLLDEAASCFSVSGWVDYHASSLAVPAIESPVYEDDKFGRASIMVLRPCMADGKKLRITAHISGDLTVVFPYMNAMMPQASYNAAGQTFTFMDGHRFIALYPRRIGLAKTDDIIDTWRVLEMLRTRFNECWKDRENITPSSEQRKRPPALEIYTRLPRINCGQCGEKTCMSFALNLWSGQAALARCRPVFGGARPDLADALVEICGGLGVPDR
jgi:ArsR family metal-binding transcriptional regulator